MIHAIQDTIRFICGSAVALPQVIRDKSIIIKKHVKLGITRDKEQCENSVRLHKPFIVVDSWALIYFAMGKQEQR